MNLNLNSTTNINQNYLSLKKKLLQLQNKQSDEQILFVKLNHQTLIKLISTRRVKN